MVLGGEDWSKFFHLYWNNIRDKFQEPELQGLPKLLEETDQCCKNKNLSNFKTNLDLTYQDSFAYRDTCLSIALLKGEKAILTREIELIKV